MKKLYLTGERGAGLFALLDDEDYEKARKHSWCLDYPAGYAMSRINYKNIRLHRFVLSCPEGMVVDHINRDKLDNRKDNLRITNKSMNAFNSKMRSTNTSGYPGVVWSGRDKRWIAQIKINYQNIILGRFVDKDDAIKARVEGERLYAISSV